MWARQKTLLKPELGPNFGVRIAHAENGKIARFGVAADRDYQWRCIMGSLLHYALVFLVVALIAAAVGFGGVAGFAMEAARLLFWVFIILFVISLVAGLVRRA